MSYGQRKKSTGTEGTSQERVLPRAHPLNVLLICSALDFACVDALSIVQTSYSENPLEGNARVFVYASFSLQSHSPFCFVTNDSIMASC
jgi:hypothetical protein